MTAIFPSQQVRVPSVDEIAETICNNYAGKFDPDRWGGMRDGMRNLHRDEAIAVRELMFTPAPAPDEFEQSEIARFGLDQPQGPVEFTFGTDGGDTA